MKSNGAPTPPNSTRTASAAVASTPTDSDPDADELLHRVRNPRSALPVRRPGASLDLDAVRIRMETEAAWLLRDRQPLDEYRQWAQGVAA